MGSSQNSVWAISWVKSSQCIFKRVLLLLKIELQSKNLGNSCYATNGIWVIHFCRSTTVAHKMIATSVYNQMTWTRPFEQKRISSSFATRGGFNAGCFYRLYTSIGRNVRHLVEPSPMHDSNPPKLKRWEIRILRSFVWLDWRLEDTYLFVYMSSIGLNACGKCSQWYPGGTGCLQQCGWGWKNHMQGQYLFNIIEYLFHKHEDRVRICSDIKAFMIKDGSSRRELLSFGRGVGLPLIGAQVSEYQRAF